MSWCKERLSQSQFLCFYHNLNDCLANRPDEIQILLTNQPNKHTNKQKRDIEIYNNRLKKEFEEKLQ